MVLFQHVSMSLANKVEPSDFQDSCLSGVLYFWASQSVQVLVFHFVSVLPKVPFDVSA